MTKLNEYSLSAAKKALIAKEFTAKELTESCLNAIDAHQDLNAYITVTAEQAMEMAKRSDEKISKGEAGILEGLPLGIKDLFCTKGVHSASCSHILNGFQPTYESTVTSNLWRDGAVMLGKTNMDELAMGSANVTSYYGPVKSPWKSKANPEKDIVPGGSSGGSSAAVSGHLMFGSYWIRHGWIYSPTCCIYRHCWDEANLW